jgi:hypothetical protein
MAPPSFCEPVHLLVDVIVQRRWCWPHQWDTLGEHLYVVARRRGIFAGEEGREVSWSWHMARHLIGGSGREWMRQVARKGVKVRITTRPVGNAHNRHRVRKQWEQRDIFLWLPRGPGHQ